ncbi:MAG: hypothetical protein ACKVYV_10085 [Limisphaerales bacterium]
MRLLLAAQAFLAFRAGAQPRPGELVPGFAPGFAETNIIQVALVRPDGGIYVGGRFTAIGGVARTNLALLKADGTVDLSFDPGLGPDDMVFSLALQGDKLLIGGTFDSYGGRVARHIARVLPNGEADPAFEGYDLFNASATGVYALLPLPDGRLLVGGSFTQDATIRRRGIARLTAEGAADPSFDSSLTSDLLVYSLRRLDDGRIAFGGLRVGRVLADGQPDPTFGGPSLGGGTGWVGQYSQVQEITLLPDGKMLCVGSFRNANNQPLNGLVRLLENGAQDRSFVVPNGADTVVRSALVQADGRLVVGGEFTLIGNVPRSRLARLLPDGAVDTVFRCDAELSAVGDIYFASVRGLRPVGGGRLLAAGIFSAADGQPRAGLFQFESGATNSRPPRVMNDGATVTAPVSDDVTLSAKLDGNPPPSMQWRHMGQDLPGATNDFLVVSNLNASLAGDYHLVLQNPLGGATGLVARVQSVPMPSGPGHVEAGFQPGSGPGPRSTLAAVSYVTTLAVPPGGGVLVGGVFSNFNGHPVVGLTRFRPDGTVDPGFTPGSGPARGASQAFLSVVLALPDGGCLLAGNHTTFNGVARSALTRLRASGAVDESFELGGFSQVSSVSAVVRQADGRLLLAGQFTATNGLWINGLARVQADGALDATFQPLRGNAGLTPAPTVVEIAALSDGRVLIGGLFTNVQGQARGNVALLAADGALDPGFAPTNLLSGRVRALAAAAGGRVVIGGEFAATAGVPRSFLARLGADGSFDAGFDASAAVRDTVYELHAFPDGRLLVAMGAPFSSGNPLAGVVRLLPDGSRDPAFVGPGAADNMVYSLAYDPAGGLWMGGGFLQVNGVARSGLARLQQEPESAFLGAPKLALRLNGNAAEISFASLIGQSYRLQYRDVVDSGNWINGLATAGTGGTLVLRDQPLTAVRRFYRVIVDPGAPTLTLRLNGNAAEISFASLPGRNYRLQHRDAVDSGAWSNGEAAGGTGGTLVLRDQPRVALRRFYRISVEN